MRELPEVESIRRGFEKEAASKKIKTAEIVGPMSFFRGHSSKKSLVDKLEGAKINSVARRGLTLIATLNNDHFMVIELGKQGLMVKATPREKVSEDTFLILSYTQGGQTRFADSSGKAVVSVLPEDAIAKHFPDLETIGLDPVEQPISWTAFGHLLTDKRSRLKQVLLDQTIVAGLGDVYVDEILFEAGLRPDRAPKSLTIQEIRRLYRSVVETLHDALKYRGTSLEGDDYVDFYGKPGDYGEHLKVFGLDKVACRRCREPIIRKRVSNTYAYLCEDCQI
ncbi:MAG: DNA-formamidopyrimidine glycosylase family protein [Acidimicrobiia bacterium]